MFAAPEYLEPLPFKKRKGVFEIFKKKGGFRFFP